MAVFGIFGYPKNILMSKKIESEIIFLSVTKTDFKTGLFIHPKLSVRNRFYAFSLSKIFSHLPTMHVVVSSFRAIQTPVRRSVVRSDDMWSYGRTPKRWIGV